MKRTMICQSTAKKEGGGKTGKTVCPCPCLGCCRLPSPVFEPETSQAHINHLATRVLAISDIRLLRDGIDILVR